MEAENQTTQTAEPAAETAAQAQSRPEPQLQAHYESLCRQGQQLKDTCPDFDLATALKDPLFLLLTHPKVGVSVARAHSLVSASRAPRTDTRPVEAGLSGQSPSLAAFSWKNASPAQREAQRRAIRQAAAQGRKLYPGPR